MSIGHEAVRVGGPPVAAVRRISWQAFWMGQCQYHPGPAKFLLYKVADVCYV
jgi:hypothetical protein